LVVAGLAGIASGLIWNIWFPINKNLWTSSYVLFAAGCALLGLAACYWLIDIRRFHETTVGKWLTWPWLVFGSNAIVAYVASVVFIKTLWLIKTSDVNPNGQPMNALGWMYKHWFARGGSTDNTSLAFAIFFVLLCFIPNWLLWRKRIFVKI
jgi:predicted acyltransferase